MAGFLDKNDRVIDMVLTAEGKRLLSRGKLRFVYFALFDDEVDYDPYISTSGSMTAEQLSGSIYSQIENCLVREAVTGYRSSAPSGSDNTNVFRPVFTAPQGLHVVPKIVAAGFPTGSIDLEVKQRRLQELDVKLDSAGNVLSTEGPFDRGTERFDPGDFSLDLQLQDFGADKDHQLGFLVRIFQSGSDGPIEIRDRRDLSNDITYGADLVVVPLDGGGVKV